MLTAGEKAPDFTANDQDGQPVSLHDFKGKKVALYFYPHDNTPTCTEQACNLRDNFALLKKHGIVVLGVSTDTEKKHGNFGKKYSLPFTLLADPEEKLVNLYGVWQLKKFMGREFMGTVRTTFLIDEKGTIAHVIGKVTAKDHTTQILAAWGME